MNTTNKKNPDFIRYERFKHLPDLFPFPFKTPLFNQY